VWLTEQPDSEYDTWTAFEAGARQPGQVDQGVRTGQVSRMATNKQELLATARAGEDIDGRPGVGEWETSTQPMEASAHPEGAVLVGRSLRMSMDTYQRIKTVAVTRGTTWSALIREWIDQGLEAAESGSEPDPVAELQRSIDAATRALRALERHPAA
jgi:hypothetical protein